MKNLIKTLIFSLFALNTYAQQASEIDPKFVKLPRYTDLAAITTSISTPTQGMLVYNMGTASNWFYNGSAWTNTAGSLALPYAQTQSSSSSLFDIENNGLGSAGRFAVTDLLNTEPALLVENYGLGSSAYFKVGGASNNNPAIYVRNDGTGIAGQFQNSSANTSPTLTATHTGLSYAAYFETNDPSNPNPTLVVSQSGTGGAASFQGNSEGNTLPTIAATEAGLGIVAEFRSFNSSANPALFVQKDGTL